MERGENMFRPHPDFPERKNVTGQELEEICLSGVLKTDGIPGPLIITSIEMLKKDGMVFVRTRTAAGVEGIGVCGENWEYFYPILEKKIAPYFIGTDARDFEEATDYMYVRDINYKIQGLAFWCCYQWLEASVLDILGKAKGVYMSELFGPRVNDHADYYLASDNRGNSPEEEIDLIEGKMARFGIRALKFKVGGRMSRNADQVEGRSEKLIFAARRHFGDDMIIHADGNGSFTPDVGIRYGRMLEDIGAYYYEEPCPFDYLWETKEVADALEIPVAFGEQETSVRRFRWLIEHDACQVVQPDIQYGGGFIRTCKIARMAERAGVTIAPHISSGIQYAHVLMLAVFTPNIGKYQELKDGYLQTRDMFTSDLTICDGRIHLPDGSGMGYAFGSEYLNGAEPVFDVRKSKRSVNY